jgi:Alpha/beta hydrolase domain
MNAVRPSRAGLSNRLPTAATVALCTVLVCLAACSSTGGSAPSTTMAPAGMTARTRPPGPVADLSTGLTGGHGAFMGESATPDLQRIGYVQHEYAATGKATSYKAISTLTHDGRWQFVPDGTMPYRTRVIVRAPAKAAAFKGTVVVEWLNVSGGLDANPEWVSLREEMVRAGDVWVGVSAQTIGVEGGPVLVDVKGVPGSEDAGKGLKAIDPVRYGTLEHPGDGYSFDIFTQVARAIRAGAGMSGLRPQRVIAAGESQSAFALVTYFNGVQPLTHTFDGFFVHSRGASGLPLVAPARVRTSPAPSAAHRRSSAPIRTRRCSTSRPKPTSEAFSTRMPHVSPTAISSDCGRLPAPHTRMRI